MSEISHTPGPWQEMPTDASIDDNTSFDNEDGNQRINTWVGIGNPDLSDGMVAIAVFYGNHDDPEFDANTRLLAAAPALLEVASAIDAMWTGEDGARPIDARSGQVREIWTNLRAAIALATANAGERS